MAEEGRCVALARVVALLAVVVVSVFRFLAERCTGTVPWTMVDALEEVKSVYEDVAHATDVFYDPLWPL